MVALLTIQILSITATSLTNLIGIMTFATDYWSVVSYNFTQLSSRALWILVEDATNGSIIMFNNTNETQAFANLEYRSSTTVMGMAKNLSVFSTHKGIFRQCNYLSENVRSYLKLPKCRAVAEITNQYESDVEQLINPGRELIRMHNVAASCAILIVLLLCICTFVGICVGILNNVVLATMTIGILYFVIMVFACFIVTLMYTVLNSERKISNCAATKTTLTNEMCSLHSTYFSYSFILGYVFLIISFITSVLWLVLQQKQRKFAQH